MDAKQLTLSQLFSDNIRYEMPESQREYVWDLKGRWEPLWNDVRDSAEAYRRSGTIATHFLGPLVLKQDPNPEYLGGTVYTKIVIDGQQRLTTLQLMLNAAKAVAEEYYKSTADALELFVTNNRASWPGGQQDYEYKIWSKASENDRKAFVLAMGEDLSADRGSTDDASQIIAAHRFFMGRIDGWIGEAATGQREEYCKALQQALLQLITVIVIDLDDNDNPRTIYETLNSRGTSLLQSDLVKNRIMDPVIVGNLSWPFIDRWWSSTPDSEQQRRNQADILLQHWVTMRGRKFVHSTEVFEAYKNYENRVSTPGYTRRHILEDITKISEIYKESESNDEDYTFLKNLASDDITPLILWLKATTGGNAHQWIKGWFALTSFVARRRVYGEDTTGRAFKDILEGIFQFVQANLRNVDDPGDRLVAKLKALVAGRTSAWPDDVMLKESFENKAIYNDPGRVVTRDILRALERGTRLRENLDNGRGLAMTIPEEVNSIEHIMPRAWRDHWQTSIDEAAQDGARRDRLVHTIGNLTLVTSDLNRRLSNNEWRDKHTMISRDAKSSELLMNQNLRLQQSGKWDVEEIIARSGSLLEIALRIWPGPNNRIWDS